MINIVQNHKIIFLIQYQLFFSLKKTYLLNELDNIFLKVIGKYKT